VTTLFAWAALVFAAAFAAAGLDPVTGAVGAADGAVEEEEVVAVAVEEERVEADADTEVVAAAEDFPATVVV